MSLFVCPICGAALEREPGRYRCPAGHSYDAASYTHLDVYKRQPYARGRDHRRGSA